MKSNNWKKSEYNKTIGIKPSQLDYIKSIKKKKSLAGQLNAIIDFYKIHNK